MIHIIDFKLIKIYWFDSIKWLPHSTTIDNETLYILIIIRDLKLTQMCLTLNVRMQFFFRYMHVHNSRHRCRQGSAKYCNHYNLWRPKTDRRNIRWMMKSPKGREGRGDPWTDISGYNIWHFGRKHKTVFFGVLCLEFSYFNQVLVAR